MKTLRFIHLFIIFSFSTLFVNGQVTINQFPENLQLYVRNEKNICEVKVSGKITNSSFDFVSIKLFKNDSLQLEAISSPTDFNFNIPINSELSEYTFELYTKKPNSYINKKVGKSPLW
ncbi:MAG: hypothetical protein IPP05_08555 [Cytophagaceae bacterium]|nr:hypothetical protein [Cytophagaceae bacterium]